MYWFSTTTERVLIISYYYSDDSVIASFFRTAGIPSNLEFKIYWFVYKAFCSSSNTLFKSTNWLKTGKFVCILSCFQHSSNSYWRITTNSKRLIFIPNRTFLVRFGGMSGEFGWAMVRILARRSRAKIPMVIPNELDMLPRRTKRGAIRYLPCPNSS